MAKTALLAWALWHSLQVPKIEANGRVAKWHGVEQPIELKQEAPQGVMKTKETTLDALAVKYDHTVHAGNLSPLKHPMKAETEVTELEYESGELNSGTQKMCDAYMDPIGEADKDDPEQDKMPHAEGLKEGLARLGRPWKMTGLKSKMKGKTSELMETESGIFGKVVCMPKDETDHDAIQEAWVSKDGNMANDSIQAEGNSMGMTPEEALGASLSRQEWHRRAAGMKCTIKSDAMIQKEEVESSWQPDWDYKNDELGTKAWIEMDKDRVTKKLKKCKKNQSVLAFDPSSSGCYEGHCLYASLVAAQYGKCTMRRMVMIRKIIAKAWGCPTQSRWLKELSETEGKTEQEYVADFVHSGWGGVPEIAQFARIFQVTVRIWGRRFEKLDEITVENATKVVNLYYARQHYCLMKEDIGECLNVRHAKTGVTGWTSSFRGGGRRSEASNSRSRSRPRLVLRSRDEVLAREQEPAREAPEYEQYEKDHEKRKEEKKERKKQRELAKQRQQEADKEDPPSQKSTGAAGSTSTKKTDMGKMKKPKTEVVEQDTSTASGSTSTRKQKPATSGEVGAGQGGSTASQAEPITEEEGLDGEFLYVIRKGKARLCALCGKWMDGYHETSKKHKSQLERYNKKEGVEQIKFAAECVNWAAATFLRGGAKNEKNPEDPEASSSSGGFAHEAEIGSDDSPPSFEYDGPISDRLLALDLALSLAGPALSRSDNDRDGDCNSERDDGPLPPCCRTDCDEDYRQNDGLQEGQEGRKEANQERISETEAVSDEVVSDQKEGNMIVQAGNSQLDIMICEHVEALELITSLALKIEDNGKTGRSHQGSLR